MQPRNLQELRYLFRNKGSGKGTGPFSFFLSPHGRHLGEPENIYHSYDKYSSTFDKIFVEPK